MAPRGPTNALLYDRRPDAEPAGAPAIRLSGVTRVFGMAPALVRVSLRIERGEAVLVRGANGAGKSTLLRLIATAISPTYGSGEVLGFDLIEQRDEIRRRVELLGHRTRLYEDLSAEENLRFTCTMFGLPTDGVGRALRRVGLAGAATDRVRDYSQGMRQRVALARAILRAPELLLLDEPYGGLDEEAKEVVDETIRDSGSEGRTVVLATHEVTRGRIAGRTLFMDEGKIGPEPSVAPTTGPGGAP